MTSRLSIAAVTALALVLTPIPANADTARATITVGGNAGSIAFSPDGSTAFVADTTTGTVSVVNVAMSSVSRTITIPGATGAGWGLGLSPDGSRVYATDNGADKLYILNASTGAVIGSAISVGGRPAALAVSPDGSVVAVANWSGSSISLVTVSNGSTRTVARTQATDLVFSPDGVHLYVSRSGSPGVVAQLKVADGTEVRRTTLASEASSIAVTPDGSTLIVTSSPTDEITLIRTSDWSTSSVSVGDDPQAVAVSPAGTLAYVSNHTAGTISVVNLTTRMVTETLTPGPNPWRLAFSPNGSWLYVGRMSLPRVYTFEREPDQGGSALGSGSGGPRAAMQQFAVASGATSAECAASTPDHVDWPGLQGLRDTGWSLSYAEWPNAGLGGYVCVRDVRWTGSTWVVSSP